jgi:hypothetical protein
MYSLCNIITRSNTIQLRDIQWAEGIVLRGQMSTAYIVSQKNLNEKDHLEELEVDTRIILKCILEE